MRNELKAALAQVRNPLRLLKQQVDEMGGQIGPGAACDPHLQHLKDLVAQMEVWFAVLERRLRKGTAPRGDRPATDESQPLRPRVLH